MIEQSEQAEAIQITYLCDEAIEAQITHLENQLAGYRQELTGGPCRHHEQFVLRVQSYAENTIGNLQSVLSERVTCR